MGFYCWFLGGRHPLTAGAPAPLARGSSRSGLGHLLGLLVHASFLPLPLSGSLPILQVHRHLTLVLPALPVLQGSQGLLKVSLRSGLHFHWAQSSDWRLEAPLRSPWHCYGFGKSSWRPEPLGSLAISEESPALDLSDDLPLFYPSERPSSANPSFRASLRLLSQRASRIPCFPVASRQSLPLPHPGPLFPSHALLMVPWRLSPPGCIPGRKLLLKSPPFPPTRLVSSPFVELVSRLESRSSCRPALADWSLLSSQVPACWAWIPYSVLRLNFLWVD